MVFDFLFGVKTEGDETKEKQMGFDPYFIFYSVTLNDVGKMG